MRRAGGPLLSSSRPTSPLFSLWHLVWCCRRGKSLEESRVSGATGGPERLSLCCDRHSLGVRQRCESWLFESRLFQTHAQHFP
ncbi:hypothetical protein A4R35_12090 [Thermogemmatispora tikiterensis]|uniref:Uncharacterized protein n=1 Tax=Thermogemmatispora tikiterensis TaxID=1825093 RepID=A0A328VF08_9CHLR|nr:hypothetical protein A4R35_12090 [Thermogemmatispora tikiterensis]